ncbi:MAG TPA: transketolase C-terminal domain-containing protein [bacterium]|nr:transketolase C-terminal domain-containing protein [bacterium]
MAGGLAYTTDDLDALTQAQIFGKVLTDVGREHPEVVSLTADLAKSTKVGEFFSAFPERSFNFGIMEQTMIGAAAGMALTGLKPYASTFGCFASMRACEQVRTDLCYPNLDVKIIGTHAGLSMGNGGTTHHATEDIGIFRTFANMTIMVPADGLETAKIIAASYDHHGPMYMRVGRGFEPPAYDSLDYDFEIGKAIEMRPGKDVTVIACGVCVLQAMEAAEDHAEKGGPDVRVINMHTVKPIDKEAIIKAAEETGYIITAEEHNVYGGLGSAVAEVLFDAGFGGKEIKVKRLGVPDVFSVIGYPEDLYAHYKFDQQGIYNAICEMLGIEAADDDWDDDE